MEGLEKVLELPKDERMEMFRQFNKLRSIMLEKRHLLRNEEMKPLYGECQQEIRKEFNINHRQYDEMFKFVKDNYRCNPTFLDRRLRNKYQVGDK